MNTIPSKVGQQVKEEAKLRRRLGLSGLLPYKYSTNGTKLRRSYLKVRVAVLNIFLGNAPRTLPPAAPWPFADKPLRLRTRSALALGLCSFIRIGKHRGTRSPLERRSRGSEPGEVENRQLWTGTATLLRQQGRRKCNRARQETGHP